MQLASVTHTLSGQSVVKFLLSEDTQSSVPLLVVGASLALAIAVIHLQDQGGLPGDQSPVWLKYSYYMVEISSTIRCRAHYSRQDIRVAARTGVEHRADDRIRPVANCGPSRRLRGCE